MMRMMESPLEDAGDISESGAVLAGERFDGVDHGVERRDLGFATETGVWGGGCRGGDA